MLVTKQMRIEQEVEICDKCQRKVATMMMKIVCAGEVYPVDLEKHFCNRCALSILTRLEIRKRAPKVADEVVAHGKS